MYTLWKLIIKDLMSKRLCSVLKFRIKRDHESAPATGIELYPAAPLDEPDSVRGKLVTASGISFDSCVDYTHKSKTETKRERRKPIPFSELTWEHKALSIQSLASM